MKLSKKARASLNQVIEKFKAGDLSPIVKVAMLKRHPDDKRPFDNWSLGNKVLAFAQTDSLDCRGYRQWQNAGRQVRKGESAAYILAPLTKKIEDKETGEDKVILYGFKAIPVFALDQTDGDHLPSFDYTPELPPLTEIAETLGVEVTWRPLPPDRYGQFDPDRKKISINTTDAKTFFHELAHAIHFHLDKSQKANGQNAHQETVAEFTATVLMSIYGLGDRTGNCWDYIKLYADDPLTAITKAMSDIEKVMAYIDNNSNQ
ncbi:MAG: M48 family peptidase [Chloroflexi bacterium]|jgi:antirestriction protein ArdC|nr:M48 family peptidase [Chloroflexota bacterium]